MKSFVIGIFILKLALVDSQPVWTAPLSTGECGPDHGYAVCPLHSCCSKFGWCGTSPRHCNAESLWISPELTTSLGIIQEKQPNFDNNEDVFSTTISESAPTSKSESDNNEAEQSKAASSSNSASTSEHGKIEFFSLKHQRPFVPAMNWCGNHEVVALTFDDGPLTGDYTASLLDDLARYNMKATFFLSPFGPSGSGYRQPEQQCILLRRMLNEGHTVAGHTARHLDLSKMSYNEIKKEIDDYNAWYKGCTGYKPTFQAVRPPFGYLKSHQREYINSLGVSVVTWNVDSNDWRGGDTTSVYSRSLERFHSIPRGGSAIILHHDLAYTWGRTRGILPMYRDYFKNLGYDFVNLDQCIELCTTTNDCTMHGDTWPGVYDY